MICKLIKKLEEVKISKLLKFHSQKNVKELTALVLYVDII